MKSLHSLTMAALLLAAVANAAGYLLDLYKITWFDDVLHGYTLFALTLAAADFASNKVLIGRERHPIMLFAIVTMVGVGIGGVWEIIEWTYDATQASNVIRGKHDTMFDLVADAIGAAIAAGTSHVMAGRTGSWVK